MTMDLQATLVAPLGDILDDFLYGEIARVLAPLGDILDEVFRVLHQAAEMAAMKLHQARMNEVCYSIKAHYLWETLEFPLPDGSELCWCCGEAIPPEFDMGRHLGFCDLKERLADEALPRLSAHESFYPHLYASEGSWV